MGKPIKGALLVAGAAIVAFFAYGFVAGSSPDAQARARARDAIALCWKEQERKSLPPEQARFVAAACEKLEADYRARWGRDP